MAKIKELSLGEWNEMVGAFHGESDRGAAILAGSFAEHALGQYLKFRIRDKEVAEALFGAMGATVEFLSAHRNRIRLRSYLSGSIQGL